MSDFKKNIILTSVNNKNKEIKGVFTIESNKNNCSGILRIYNLKATGTYCLGILVNGVPLQKTTLNTEVVFCKVELPNTVQLTSKIAVVVVECEGVKNTPIVFGTTENAGWSDCYNFFPAQDLNQQIEQEIKNQIPELKEAVNQNNPMQNNISINNISNMQTKTEHKNCESCVYKQNFYNQHTVNNCECGNTETKRYNTTADTVSNKEQCLTQENNNKTFFEIVSPKIDELFELNAPCEELNSLVACSRWVKVIVDESEKYYIGVIYENSSPKYIAYAVDGVYSKTPPKQLEENAQWLPINSLFPEGEGYWLMFQDAITGD